MDELFNSSIEWNERNAFFYEEIVEFLRYIYPVGVEIHVLNTKTVWKKVNEKKNRKQKFYEFVDDLFTLVYF